MGKFWGWPTGDLSILVSPLLRSLAQITMSKKKGTLALRLPSPLKQGQAGTDSGGFSNSDHTTIVLIRTWTAAPALSLVHELFLLSYVTQL